MYSVEDRTALAVVPQVPSTRFFETGSLIGPRHTKWARLLSLLLRVRLSVCYHRQAVFFTWVLDIKQGS